MGINTLLAVDLASAACREIYVSSPTYLYFLFFTHSVLLLFSLSPYWAVLILVPFFSGQIVSERSIMIFVKLLFLFVYITFIYICVYMHTDICTYITLLPQNLTLIGKWRRTVSVFTLAMQDMENS